MAKGIRIKGSEIRIALGRTLNDYRESTINGANKAAEAAARKLVSITQTNAPARTGKYRRGIACKELERRPFGNIWVWYVKPPDHRLTHLLVHGHAKRGGGRTRANPFLDNAVDQVQPEFEAAIEKAARGAT